MPRTRLSFGLFAVLIVLAAGAAGCGRADEPDRRRVVTDEASEPRPYTTLERNWLRKMGAWRSAMNQALLVLLPAGDDPRMNELLHRNDTRTVRLITDALEILAGCSRSFRQFVPPAPSVRLQDGEEAVLAACPDLEYGADEDLQAIADNDAKPLDAGDVHLRGGSEYLWVANEEVLAFAEGRELPEAESPSEQSHIDPLLGKVADTLADRLPTSVEARCWSERDWPGVLAELSAYYSVRTEEGDITGFAMPELVRIHLAPQICDRLGELMRDPEATDEATAIDALAVATLAHETMHVAWIFDEARAECYAAQLVDETAVRLGLPRDYAEALADVYWSEVFPALPVEYRLKGCDPRGRPEVRRPKVD